MQVKISGASDDLIEIDGDIVEEFNPADEDDEPLLAFSDGTILRIAYTRGGVWRITPVVTGTATLHIEPAPEDDPDNYSDVATLTGDNLNWVVVGKAYAKARKA